MESNALALGVFWSSTQVSFFWSPKLQLWAYFGVQSFSFGRILEFNYERV
ncbi:hypothetical protein QUF54_02120 [Candidatus Marithioploca araucensis]|uniref:Uncharacterized protein n=1 Tax=Candidatus Marithioploca araucensis TaxID=70273 RepID=A0ABT7VRH7_9GAMM|nr:hypothetical protein [Candidatus Marithioploca araucensis]